MLKKRQGKPPHRVTLCRWAVPKQGVVVDDRGNKRGKGGRLALFAFSWRDLAKLLDLEVPTVQKLAKKRAFDVTDLKSIAEFWARRRKIGVVEPAAAGDPVSSGELN